MIVIDILFVIAIIFILLVNYLIRNLAKELKEMPNKTKLSGFEVAKIISSKLTKEEPHIIKKSGKFLDHYNHERNVIKLSDEVFDGEDIYAAIVAINIAIETNPEKSKIAETHKFTAIMVLISYIVIVSGIFINNVLFLRFGFIIFILALILEFLLLDVIVKNKAEYEELYNFIKKANVIKPIEEIKDKLSILLFIPIMRLPYSFFIYFR